MVSGLSDLVLIFALLTALQLQHGRAQCVAGCGCTVAQDCCLVVTENQNAGTVVGRDNSTAFMIVIGPFTNPVFSFDTSTSSPGAGDVFAVNASTGEIFTWRPLDREGETFTTQGMSFMDSGYCIQVGITTTESGDPSRQSCYQLNVIVADVNDNPPRFGQQTYTVSIPETTESNPTVECSDEMVNLLTATDTDNVDNALVRYRVEGSDLFVISDPTTPCVVNAPGVVLDRDNGPAMYLFVLVASDPVQPSLASRVTVAYVLKDVNDIIPVFESTTYEISILESLQPQTVIRQLIAEDSDLGNNGGSNLVYSIDEESDFFFLEPDSGNLTLINSVDADWTPSGENVTYTLTVHANDGEHTGEATVIITVLDVNEPAWVSFGSESGTIAITENEARGLITTIRFIDTDRTHQDGDNTIQVIGSDGSFVVRAFSGSIFLSQVAGVDYEQQTTVQVMLETTEMGVPVIRQNITYNLTVLNVNDNLPSLSRTQFTFPEGTGDEMIVDLSLYVFDDDIGESGLIQKYELISVTDEMMNSVGFTGPLNESTGVLSLGNFEIDRETLMTLNFVVTITDMGEPPLSQLLNFTVEITDINDNPPMFEEASYTFDLMEGEPLESRVGTVRATDPDYLENGTVIYSIEGTSQFVINERTGEISSGTTFDREKRDLYQIFIDARDNNPISPMRAVESTSVTIVIDDINDNDPVFEDQERDFPINTDTLPGSVVAIVTSKDADESPFNDIVYRIEPNSFFSIVQNRSGMITLSKSLSSPGEFHLNISAFNPGREEYKNTITITITVSEAPVTNMLIVGVAVAASAALLLLIVITLIIIVCVHCRNRKFRGQSDVVDNSNIVTLNEVNEVYHPSIIDARVSQLSERYYHSDANIDVDKKGKLSQ